MEQERKKFEDWKLAENQKIQKEKKLHESILKDLKNLPNKKERAMIESLQEQIIKINQENSKKESNYRLISERLKTNFEEAKSKIEK